MWKCVQRPDYTEEISGETWGELLDKPWKREEVHKKPDWGKSIKINFDKIKTPKRSNSRDVLMKKGGGNRISNKKTEAFEVMELGQKSQY